MKRFIFTMLLIGLTASAYSQKPMANPEPKNGIEKKGAQDDVYFGRSRSQNKSFTEAMTPNFILYKAGEYLRLSAKAQYIAMGTTVVSGVMFAVGADEKEGDARNTCFIAGGIFGAAAVISAVLSVHYKWKSGNCLKAYATENGAGLAYIF